MEAFLENYHSYIQVHRWYRVNYRDTPLHNPKVTVDTAMLASGIIELYFSPRQTDTVTSKRYRTKTE